MQQNRALGLGLIAVGAVLGGIMLLWLLVSLVAGQLSPGGAVLGLLLLAVLALPLVGGGLYVLSQGQQEAAATATFQAQRRTFDADRLFRAAQGRELLQLARRLDAVGGAEQARLAARLRDLAEDLERPPYDQAAWYEAVELGQADQEALQRYDDLLSDGVRRLNGLVSRLESGEAVLPELGVAVQAWEGDFNQRADLLRGRRAPAVAPTDLLRETPGAEATHSAAQLTVGDAVSRDGLDYLVETSVSYFAGGRTWGLNRLVAESEEAWLAVTPGGLGLFWMQVGPAPVEPGAGAVDESGATCRLAESFTAAARVQTRDGAEASTTVEVWRYECADRRLVWVERWSDEVRAYGGEPIEASEIDIWPAEVRPRPG